MFGNRNDTNVKINTLRRGEREFNNIHYINTLHSNERQTGDQNQRKMLCTLRRAKRFRFVLISGFLTIAFSYPKKIPFFAAAVASTMRLNFWCSKSVVGRPSSVSFARNTPLNCIRLNFCVQAKFIIINQA